MDLQIKTVSDACANVICPNRRGEGTFKRVTFPNASEHPGTRAVVLELCAVCAQVIQDFEMHPNRMLDWAMHLVSLELGGEGNGYVATFDVGENGEEVTVEGDNPVDCLRKMLAHSLAGPANLPASAPPPERAAPGLVHPPLPPMVERCRLTPGCEKMAGHKSACGPRPKEWA